MTHRVAGRAVRCGGVRPFGLPLLGLLASCASHAPAPVVELSQGPDHPAAAASVSPRPVAQGFYRVVRGDTLYAIAFRHGLDFRDLAAWNGIESPYRIYPEQELRLTAPPVVTRPVAAVPPAAVAKPAAAPVFETVVDTPAQPAAKPNAAPSAAKPATAPVPPPAAAAPSPPTPTPAGPVTAESPLPAAAASPAAPAGTAPSWRWPGKGPVIAGFVAGDQTRQGIDIGGQSGDPVLAAADGEVVYSGNGLLGYGELIIVKHNASFLSAYGHNRKRLVQEGDRVRAGQQIAEMGSTASSRDELHFEIRRNGKPVNPIEFLPPR
jgi:lipoprotein NlpD